MLNTRRINVFLTARGQYIELLIHTTTLTCRAGVTPSWV